MDRDDPRLALRAEEACLAAWPAPRAVLMDGWLLRFGGGHTSRANSVNVVGASRHAPAGKIAACEALYRAQGLPTIVRLSSAMVQPGLAPALDAAGYGPPRDHSLVLFADLGGSGPSPGSVRLTEGSPDARWLAASAALAGLDAPAAALRARILDSLAVPAAFAAVEVDGAMVAQAFGAVHGGLVCLNAVATAPDHRGRGLAGRAIAAVLDWAKAHAGAEGACLQVMADNPPALALYRRLGFMTELSRYHYRDGSGSRSAPPRLAPRAVSVHLADEAPGATPSPQALR